jgi:hypothetical protein
MTFPPDSRIPPPYVVSAQVPTTLYSRPSLSRTRIAKASTPIPDDCPESTATSVNVAFPSVLSSVPSDERLIRIVARCRRRT